MSITENDHCGSLFKNTVRETSEAKLVKEEISFKFAFQMFRMIHIWFVLYRRQELPKRKVELMLQLQGLRTLIFLSYVTKHKENSFFLLKD